MVFKIFKEISTIIVDIIFHIPLLLWVHIIFPLSRLINNNPLIILQLLGIIFLFGLDWLEIGVLLLFFILTSMLAVFSMGLLSTKSELFELFKFLHIDDVSRFVEVEKESFIDGLETDGITVRDNKDVLVRSMFEKLRIFILPSQIDPDSKIPFELICYPSANGAWLFLKSDYKEMGGLEKFQLLHEIGHLSGIALSRSLYGSYNHVYISLLFCLLIAFRIELNLFSVSALIIIPVLTFIHWNFRYKTVANNKLADELDADHFALLHSQMDWFKNYPSQTIAQKLLYDRCESEAFNTNRMNAFCEILDNLRAEKPIDGVLSKYFPETNLSIKITVALTTIISAIAYLSCFIWYGNASSNYIISLSVITLLSIGCALIYYQVHNEFQKIITSHLKPTKSEKEIKDLQDAYDKIDKIGPILDFFRFNETRRLLPFLQCMIKDGLNSEGYSSGKPYQNFPNEMNVNIIEDILDTTSVALNSKTYLDNRKLVASYTNDELIAFTNSSTKKDWLKKPAFFRALVDEVVVRFNKLS